MNQRLFIALPLGQELSSRLRLIMEAMRPRAAFQKWVHPHDLHITLKFLGDTRAETLAAIQARMKAIAAAQSPFQLSLQGIGAFGRPTAPSIMWVGVGGQVSALNSLQAQTEAAMQALGYAREDRPYSPHITIARKYRGEHAFSKADLSSTEIEHLLEPIPWTADGVTLFRSHLSRTPMYEAVDHYSFSQK